MFTHGSLFSGIGGFDLAAEWMGWRNLFHCERNPFGQKVLKHYWPDAELFEDITKSDFTKYANRIDVLSGGFPCQPYSTAGKRLGKADDRHLWPEMLRAIREIRPVWVVGENVRGLVSWNGGMVFDEVQSDLEAEGYEVLPFILPACAVNAPHRRDRVWFVAYSKSFNAARIGGCCNSGWPSNKEVRSGLQHKSECDGTKGPTQNTNDDGRGGIQRQSKPGERGQRDAGTGDHERVQANDGETGDVGNTKFTGLEGRIRPRESEGFEPGYTHDDAPHTGGIESQGGMHPDGTGTAERYTGTRSTRFDRCPGWDNFPTEPPVRWRNDGLSTGLAGITVSKHRKESIMAYGNAVVPQVVLQIFKAIEAYDTQIHPD